MARRRGFLPVRTGSTRRKTGWGQGPGGSTNTVISASSKVIVGSGVASVSEAFLTVVRIRGNLQIILTAHNTDADGYTGAFGIGKVTDDAFSIGATAMPGPVTDADWGGWQYHQFINVHAPDAALFGADAAQVRNEVDTKAMRKLESNEVIFAMVELTEIGIAVANVFFDSRMLLKFA